MERPDSPSPSWYNPPPDDERDPVIRCWNCSHDNDRTETCARCGVLLDEPYDPEDRAYDESVEREMEQA